MHGYRHIILATDFAEGSRPACLRAGALQQCFGAQLTLLHVVENFPQDRSNEEIGPEKIDPEKIDPKTSRETLARSKLDALAEATGCSGALREVRFTSESAWQEIARFAREQEADLIVIAGRAHSGPGTLVPSTSGHLSVQRPCDILTVHAQNAGAR